MCNHQQTVLTNSLLCGVGGVGKTELAKYYAYKNYNKLDKLGNPYYELICWFNGSQAMQAQLEEFANLSFNEVWENYKEPELLRMVYEKLNKLNSWLLIIDDVDTEHKAEVLRYLPQNQEKRASLFAGQEFSKRHHVLLTSRITDLYESEDDEYNSYKIAVGMYSEQESISYLYARLGIKGDEQKLKIRPVLSRLVIYFRAPSTSVSKCRIVFAKKAKK